MAPHAALHLPPASVEEIVARFVDPDVSTRYGTFIYSRCS